MRLYEEAKLKEEEMLAELKASIVPTRFDDCFTHPSLPQGATRVRSWKTKDGKYSGTVTTELVKVKGYTPWAAVREMTTHEGRMHCIAWVLYLIENRRGTIRPLEAK